MNVPNIITLIRFLLIPVFAYSFFGGTQGRYIAGAIFVLAGISDVLDGYIARKYNLVSRVGEAIDPLADKLMQITVVLCLFIANVINIWLVIAVIIKEALMIIVGSIMMAKINRVIPSKWYGKAAAALFFIVLFISIIFIRQSNYYVDIMFIAALALSLFAFINYCWLYLKNDKLKKAAEESNNKPI